MKFIGVDPDIYKSGFCVWDSEKQKFDHIGEERFFDLIEKIKALDNTDITVIIEAGWLNKKSNFHGQKYQPKAVGEKIAKAVGANHQVGILFIEWCVKNNIRCVEVRPAKKKLNSSEFNRITGYTKRTNSEKRDAAMLVFGR